MSETGTETFGETAPIANGKGCVSLVLMVLTTMWVVGNTLIFQSGAWVLEQTIFEGSLNVKDLRWLIALGYALALVVPFFVAFLLIRNPYQKALYRLLFLASLLALLLVPSRLLSIIDMQSVMAYQILVLMLFFLGLQVWSRRLLNSSSDWHSRPLAGFSWGLVSGGMVVFPWVLWGALGSPLDTILGLVVGVSFGACVGFLLKTSFFSVVHAQKPYRGLSVFRDGVVVFLVLLIMVGGLAQNGNQALLFLSVPPLSWTLAVLSRYKADVKRSGNWGTLAICLGLVTAWPLIFVDPDELMLVINGSSGELIQWVNKAILVTVVIIILLTIFWFILRRSVENGMQLLRMGKVVLAVGWLASFVVVYFVYGRPGFYGERLFVILKDQVDVSKAASIVDDQLRREFVYQTLVTKADESQRELRRALNRWRIPYTPYYLVNALEVRGGPLIRWWLQTRPEVDRILDSPVLRPLPKAATPVRGAETKPQSPDWNLKLIGADRVWELGIRGAGIVIGQSDSGVQGNHPELVDSYRGRDGNHNYNWFDPWNGTSSPTDIGGHGTHTLGTIVGNSVGVAPDASWIGCVNLARNLGNPALYLDCWQFMLSPFPQNGDPFKDGKPAMGAHILNNSWGCPWVEGCDAEVYLSAVKALRSAGVFVVVSAGNAGYSGCGSVKDPPAIYDEVYSIGAVNRDGQLAEFSSLGPVEVDGSYRVKPDIIAPGAGVLSAYPNSSYEIASGTSMAGPHVAGVVALMWSANPDLIGEIDLTEQILNETAKPYEGVLPECVEASGEKRNAAGFGLVDAYAAVQRALEFRRK